MWIIYHGITVLLWIKIDRNTDYLNMKKAMKNKETNDYGQRQRKERPPGSEQLMLKEMFHTGSITAAATPESVYQSTLMFQSFTPKVFGAHFRNTKARLGEFVGMVLKSPYKTWTYTDHQLKLDFVCVSINVFTACKKMTFDITEDRLQVVAKFVWATAMHDPAKMFHDSIAKRRLSADHPMIHAIQTYGTLA
ncbi:hypothetical protein Bhyg_08325 [Pseudolycoriella hygida]|uniref:Uncharacterized protein n=1 Tax=Pseudolycoriella hygida TaxID=35572 RepID=A0A9Q0S4U0_9DIPT|nr:hypothetical protein Bhyg_08325 [Pseudolycoriella hygida]